MSADVTEPNSLPSSPTRAEKVSWIASIFLSRGDARVFRGLETALFLGDTLLVARGRFVRDTARQQEVARKARGHFHDVARMTELVHRLTQNDFHNTLDR
jgi:hypothetical protein